MSNKYSKKTLGNCKKKIYNRCNKNCFKKSNSKNGRSKWWFNKIANKITIISKKSSQNTSKELHSKTDENEIQIPKERYISPEKRQQIINELRLV